MSIRSNLTKLKHPVNYSLSFVHLLTAGLSLLVVPQVVVAQENKTTSTKLNSAGNLVLPDFVATVKSLNLPPSKIQRDGSHNLEQYSFTYIHQILGAREGIMVNFKIPFSQNSITPTANGRAVIARIARAMKFLDASVG